MQKIILSILFYLFTISLSAQSFPTHWVGKWTGNLEIWKANKEVQNIPMSLDIQATDTAHTFIITYNVGQEKPDVRNYTLITINDTIGHYAIDENNSIILDAYLFDDCLYERFSLLGTDLFSRICVDGETMYYEILSGKTKPVRESGNTIIETDTIPAVNSQGVLNVTKAILTKEPNQERELLAPTNFTIGTIDTIHSNILNESREYLISLPTSYEGDDFYVKKSYPILILLDGQRLFHLASGMIQSMSSGGIEQIPEMIVVAVSNTNRNRDFLPLEARETNDTIIDNSQLFRQFLETELIPHLESQYRTNSCKILAGHSFGGLFAVNSFLAASSFNAYLAIDPSLWWAEEQSNQQAKTFLQQPLKQATSIYISQANNPFHQGIEANRMGRAIQAFKRILEASNDKNLRHHVDFFEQEDHFSVPLLSLYQGLQYLFEGYKFPLFQLQTQSAEDIRAHYEQLAHRFGGATLAPGKLLHQVAWFLISSEEELDKGIDLLELVKAYYPDSYIPYHSLGEAYELKGNPKLALEHFERAIELNPEDEEAGLRVEVLGN